MKAACGDHEETAWGKGAEDCMHHIHSAKEVNYSVHTAWVANVPVDGANRNILRDQDRDSRTKHYVQADHKQGVILGMPRALAVYEMDLGWEIASFPYLGIPCRLNRATLDFEADEG